MSSGYETERVINEYCDKNLVVDGIIGSKTISALNDIQSSQIGDFMKILIKQRMYNLEQMQNWPTSKNGWTERTKAY